MRAWRCTTSVAGSPSARAARRAPPRWQTLSAGSTTPNWRSAAPARRACSGRRGCARAIASRSCSATAARCSRLVLAAAALGAIAVPLNTRLAPPEIAELLRDCRPAVVFHEASLAPTVELALARAGRPGRVLAVGGEPCAYEAALASALPAPEIAAVSPEDAMLLMYTSGTTGVPKGALLPHRKTLFNCAERPALLRAHASRQSARRGAPLPFLRAEDPLAAGALRRRLARAAGQLRPSRDLAHGRARRRDAARRRADDVPRAARGVRRAERRPRARCASCSPPAPRSRSR